MTKPHPLTVRAIARKLANAHADACMAAYVPDPTANARDAHNAAQYAAMMEGGRAFRRAHAAAERAAADGADVETIRAAAAAAVAEFAAFDAAAARAVPIAAARAAVTCAPRGVAVVPFAAVADVVRDAGVRLFRADRFAVYATNADAERVRDAIGDRVRADVVRAVADAAPFAAASVVVVVPSANASEFRTLAWCGVRCVIPETRTGCRPFEAHNGLDSPRWCVSLADAVAFAAGVSDNAAETAAPLPVLPGEFTPPPAPVHADAAPTLPTLKRA